MEHDAHRIADADRRRVDLVDLPIGAGDEVSDEPDRRVLLQRDHDHVVGGELLIRGQQWRGGGGEKTARPPPPPRAPPGPEPPRPRGPRPPGAPAPPPPPSPS